MAAEDSGSGDATIQKNARQIEQDFNANKEQVMKMHL